MAFEETAPSKKKGGCIMKTQPILLDPPPGYDPDLVKRAAQFVTPGYVDPIEIAEASRRLAAVSRVSRGILPIEATDGAEVASTLTATTAECAGLHRRSKIHEFSEGKYMLFDLEPLLWRSRVGFPKLAVFAPQTNESGFHVTMDDLVPSLVSGRTVDFKVHVTPNMPKPMLACYADIVELVRTRARNAMFTKRGLNVVIDKFSVSLKAKFGGLIPDYVKEEMYRANASGLFVSFFIIAEVKRWEWNIDVVSHRADPLLVGFDGYQFWLLEAFDTTSLEKLVADEYCVKPN